VFSVQPVFSMISAARTSGNSELIVRFMEDFHWLLFRRVAIKR
jgi:hypothetical protein